MQIKSWQIALIGTILGLLMFVPELSNLTYCSDVLPIIDGKTPSPCHYQSMLIFILYIILIITILIIPFLLKINKFKKNGANLSLISSITITILIFIFYILNEIMVIYADINSITLIAFLIPCIFLFFSGIYYFKVESKN